VRPGIIWAETASPDRGQRAGSRQTLPDGREWTKDGSGALIRSSEALQRVFLLDGVIFDHIMAEKSLQVDMLKVARSGGHVILSTMCGKNGSDVFPIKPSTIKLPTSREL
jgi:hypothetical protein